jgi:hypothetical protein
MRECRSRMDGRMLITSLGSSANMRHARVWKSWPNSWITGVAGTATATSSAPCSMRRQSAGSRCYCFSHSTAFRGKERSRPFNTSSD